MRASRLLVTCLLIAGLGCTTSAEPGDSPAKTPTTDSSEKVVRQVIADLLKADPASIQMDKPISEPPLKADELDLVEIVLELEERLNVEISDDAVERYAGAKSGKQSLRITPNQLVSLAKEAPKPQQSKRKK